MITRRRVFIEDTEIPISIHGYVIGIGEGVAFIDELFIIDYKDKLNVDKITLNFAGGWIYYPNTYDKLLRFPDLTINLTKDDSSYDFVRYTYHGGRFIDYDKTVVVCENSFISWNYIDVSETIRLNVESQVNTIFKTKNIKIMENSQYGDINVDYDEYNVNREYYNIKINNPIYISSKEDSYFTYPVISIDGTSKYIPKTVIATYFDDTDADSSLIDKTFTATISADPSSEYVYSVKFPYIPRNWDGELFIFDAVIPDDYYEDDQQNPFYYNYELTEDVQP